MTSVTDNNKSNYTNDLDSMLSSSIDVSTNTINNLNIIINEDECSDSFFESICNLLSEKGIVYTVSHSGNEINVDNSVVVTLDMKYYGGNDTLIFAPFDNAREGQSDSLSLAMYAAFLQKGFDINGLTSGKIRFLEEAEEKKKCIVPTKTEELINSNYLTSFVTISFGTGMMDPNTIADSLIDGLARFKYYQDFCDLRTDLIYRSSEKDNAEGAANYFGVPIHNLISYNHLENPDSLGGKVIVNPEVANVVAFNINNTFYSSKENEKLR